MEKKKGFWKEFKEFVARGNVLDMAVGIIIGGAFTAIITAIVNNILTPLLQIIPGMGGEGYGALQLVLREATIVNDVEVPAVIIDFGVVISAIISFLLTAFVLFLIVRSINRVRAKAEERKAKEAAELAAKAEPQPETPPAPPAPTTEELLVEIRDLLKDQSKN